MEPFEYRHFRRQADEALQDAVSSPRRLVLIHTGAALLLSLLLNILHYVLQRGIAGTGGLSGIGTRTVLELIQTLLQILSLVLLPFWNVGYRFTTLQLSRRQRVGDQSLLEGFRYWGVVLRTLLLRGLVLLIAAFLGGQFGSVLFMLSPAGLPMTELAANMDPTMDMSALMNDPAYMAAMEPMIPWVAAGAVVLMLPVLYLTRFMLLHAIDQPQRGAFPSLFLSIRLTFRRLGKLLVLDLRFWWFYALEAVILAVCYGDVLLPMAGVSIPLEKDTAMFLFFGISLLLQLCLRVWRKNDVFVTYALAYDYLKEMPKATPPSRPAPQYHTPQYTPQQPPQQPPQSKDPQPPQPSGPVPWNY